MAGGGRLNGFSFSAVGERSLPWISAEAAGVGGRLERGIALCKPGSMQGQRHVLVVSVESVESVEWGFM